MTRYPELNQNITTNIKQINPWWQGNSMEKLPDTRRHIVDRLHKRLQYNIAPIIVLKGPRQIGKTTACFHVIRDFLEQGIEPIRIMRIQFDNIPSFKKINESILQIIYWYEDRILQSTLNNMANQGKGCYIFLDEIQNIPDWSTQLKFIVDNSTVQMLITGSSSLKIEKGRDSLAGRIHTIEENTLSLTEVGVIRKISAPTPFLADNGITKLIKKEFWCQLKEFGKQNEDYKRLAFSFFAKRGSYPIAHLKTDLSWELLADQLNETIIRRVLLNDLHTLSEEQSIDINLLEELFKLCCRYAGQSLSYTFLGRELEKVLDSSNKQTTIKTCLKILADTLLIRIIYPLEYRKKKQIAAFKICLSDHSLRASWLQENISLDIDKVENTEEMFANAGYLAESIVGSLFSNISGLDISYLPAKDEDPEIDFIITIGDHKIPVEIKYRNSIQKNHYKGLQWFLDNPNNRSQFGILITKKDEEHSEDDRIIPISISSLLLMR